MSTTTPRRRQAGPAAPGLGGFRVGRVGGVDVDVHWSWVVVFVLITWSLAAGVFPEETPGEGDGTYAVMGVVAAVAFFAALLAHELGHALTARRLGVGIDGITLWLFGGVARLRGAFPGARAEFLVAVAGPAVSVVIGVACILAGWAVGSGGPVEGVLYWLGYINLFLVAFNLLPALPLDGGRILHAVLWGAKGSLLWATRRAAAVARVLAYVMIGGGLALFVTVGAFGGAWLAFLGWFLLQAATAEARGVLVRQALHGVRVADLMTPDPHTVPADASLERFVDDVAWRHRNAGYPVMDDGRPAGILMHRAVSAVPRSAWPSTPVREVLTPLDEVPVLAPHDAACDAMEKLSGSAVNRGLVMEGGRLVGILSATDLMRALEVGRLRDGDGPAG